MFREPLAALVSFQQKETALGQQWHQPGILGTEYCTSLPFSSFRPCGQTHSGDVMKYWPRSCILPSFFMVGPEDAAVPLASLWERAADTPTVCTEQNKQVGGRVIKTTMCFISY